MKHHVADKSEVALDDAVALFPGDDRGFFGNVAVEFVFDLEFYNVVAAIVNAYAVFSSAIESGVLLVEVCEINIVKIKTPDKILSVVSVFVVPHEAQRPAAKLEILSVGYAVFQLMAQTVGFI